MLKYIKYMKTTGKPTKKHRGNSNFTVYLSLDITPTSREYPPRLTPSSLFLRKESWPSSVGGDFMKEIALGGPAPGGLGFFLGGAGANTVRK